MKLRILDRYIIKELLSVFFFGIAAFGSVFVGTDVLFRLANYIAKYGAPLWTVLKMFLASLPEIILYTLPMSMLLASLLTFGRLSSTSEVIAMKAGGISFTRLMRPVVIMSLVVTGIAFSLTEHVVPASRVTYQYILKTEVEQNVRPDTQEHVVFKVVTKGEMGQLIYARQFDEATGRLEDIVIQEFEKGELVRIESAEFAEFVGGRWTIYDGVINEVNPVGKTTSSINFTQQQLPNLSPPAKLSLSQKKPKEMSISELRQQIRIVKNQKEANDKWKLELYQRYSLPFACLMVALIGSPLGLQPQRASSSMGFGLSVVIVLIYYVFLSVCTSLGQSGKIMPAVAAWIPNIVGFVAGGILVHRASK